MKRKIEDYQLKELNEKQLFINKYDLSVKYDYELASVWKEFFFDILQELLEKQGYIEDVPIDLPLFSYLKNNWSKIIKENDLKIDIRDYTDLDDYISYEDWYKNPDCGIAYFNDGIYLIQITC